MTEEEWLKSNLPKEVVAPLRERHSERKARLFTVSCCRHLWDVITDARSRTVIEIAELFADGEAQESDLRAAMADGGRVPTEGSARRSANHEYSEYHILAARLACFSGHDLSQSSSLLAIVAACSLITRDPDAYPQGQDAMGAVCCDLLRDIFGNPFRPVAMDPTWLTSTAVALARGIYDDRAFDRMPILGDALEDAGCDHADILAHCRDADATHVRGCWVVDLVLGKE